ncbi:MAG: NAD-dependent epimerase/dehydratase family protein [Candidatus Omnitrophota bacterium]
MSDCVLVTGASGLIGSQTVEFFAEKGFKVIGIDNDMRAYFFGPDGSTLWRKVELQKKFSSYEHHGIDIRDNEQLKHVFEDFSGNIKLIVHTAAQPSHDWAAREPLTDFGINAFATLNLLELTRKHCPRAIFIFTSTNKVYGDTPNFLPLIEKETRWELPEGHRFFDGIDETMSIDQSKHSLFGASKVAGDILVQEYGRYFGMKTACFRGGCLTGPNHSGAELHGFLSYLMKCCVENRVYKIFGYKGKQVRDNIHSFDLVNAFWHFYQNPREGEVYNRGGGRANSCSIQEAVAICEEVSGKKLRTEYVETNRSGDHIWYISSLRKFINHYPGWSITINLKEILKQIHMQLSNDSERERL